MTISNPLVVERDRPFTLKIAFEGTPVRWRIRVTGADASNGETLYITARLVEESMAEAVTILPPVDVNALAPWSDGIVDLETVFANARERGLSHQDVIKARGAIYPAAGGLIEVRVDDVCRDEADAYRIHTALIDGAAMGAEAVVGRFGREKRRPLHTLIP